MQYFSAGSVTGMLAPSPTNFASGYACCFHAPRRAGRPNPDVTVEADDGIPVEFFAPRDNRPRFCRRLSTESLFTSRPSGSYTDPRESATPTKMAPWSARKWAAFLPTAPKP